MSIGFNGAPPRRVGVFIVLVLILFAGLSSKLFAQGQSDTTDVYNISLEELMEMTITTASKKSETIAEAGAVASIITAKEIESYGARNLMEVIDRVTSFYAFGNFFIQNNITAARGGASRTFYNSYVLVLLDGRPVRESVGHGFNSPLYMSFPVDRIERIEIVRGPGSVLYGTSAYYGVINIITRTAKTEPGIKAGVRYGSFGTVNPTLAVQKRIGDVDISAGLNIADSKGWDFTARGQTDVIRNKANTSDSIYLPAHTIKNFEKSLGIDVSVSYKGFRLAGLYAKTKSPAMGFSPQWGITNDPLSPGEIHLNESTDRIFVDLGYQREIIEGWSVSANATNNRYKFEIARDNYVNDHLTSTCNDYLLEITNFITPAENLNIVVGGLLNSQHADAYIRVFQPVEGGGPYDFIFYNPYDPSLPKNPDPFPNIKPVSETWSAGYVQADYRPLKFLKFIAGAQANKIPALKVNIAPRVGGIINFTGKMGLKLLYGQAFRAANFLERKSVTIPYLVGYDNLKPETIATTEVQYFYSASKFEAYLTAFSSVEDNRVVVTAPKAFPSNGGELYMVTHANSSEKFVSRGIEFEMKANVSDHFSLNGSASWFKTENENGLPNYMIKIGAIYSTTVGVTVGAFNSFFGEGDKIDLITTRHANADVTAYNNMSLNIRYDLSKMFSVQKCKLFIELYGTNLLDEKIYYPESYSKTINSLPGRAGRALYGKISFKM